jgi:hypothetical protein
LFSRLTLSISALHGQYSIVITIDSRCAGPLATLPQWLIASLATDRRQQLGLSFKLQLNKDMVTV